MKHTKEQIELSESLLAACKAAGIEKLKFITQGASGAVYHCENKPSQVNGKITFVVKYDGGAIIRIDHPTYADDWRESLLEWVEPQGEPLADVLARHGESESDDACKIAYRAFMSEDHRTITGFPRAADIYERAWQDALKWKGGSEQASGIEALVCEDIAKRQQVGIAKYGTTLADNPLTLLEGLQHAYEESLDFPIYLKKIITDLKMVGND